MMGSSEDTGDLQLAIDHPNELLDRGCNGLGPGG